MKSGRRRDLPRRTLMLESATAFGDDGSKVQAGGAGLGASVKTSRRCDRSMSEHAAHNLILARPRIEENLATGVPGDFALPPSPGNRASDGSFNREGRYSRTYQDRISTVYAGNSKSIGSRF